MSLYRCILADPPWPQTGGGRRLRKREQARRTEFSYSSMSINEIETLPIGRLADVAAHLWLWTTNQHLESGFRVMAAWGFKYLAPIHWIKPSGQGSWFINRTQTLLFGYKQKCVFPLMRYRPNIIVTGAPVRHSQKPEESFSLIESVSPGPRLELFARQKRHGWDAWGNEVKSDVKLVA